MKLFLAFCNYVDVPKILHFFIFCTKFFSTVIHVQHFGTYLNGIRKRKISLHPANLLYRHHQRFFSTVHSELAGRKNGLRDNGSPSVDEGMWGHVSFRILPPPPVTGHGCTALSFTDRVIESHDNIARTPVVNCSLSGSPWDPSRVRGGGKKLLSPKIRFRFSSRKSSRERIILFSTFVNRFLRWRMEGRGHLRIPKKSCIRGISGALFQLFIYLFFRNMLDSHVYQQILMSK